jgi:hypothetical protein
MIKAAPTLDLAQAQRFLDLLDRSGVFTFQTFDDAATKSHRLNRVLHGTLAQHADEMAKLNARGAGIFVMVNRGDGVVHSGAKTCRTVANVVAVRGLFADLDGAPLGPAREALTPDIVVESSPKRWHCYWLTDDCPLGDFKDRQRQIAARFGGDSKVCDLPRVMRLPGFLHQKGEPFMTRVVYPE